MTPEQLDEARAKEAQRLWEGGQEAGSSSWVVAARLAREGWTPPEPEPEPVDPDVLAWREWAKRSILKHISGRDVDAGKFDDVLDAHAYLAGARMAREQERERADMPIRMAEELVGRLRSLLHSLPLQVRDQAGVKWDLDEAFANAALSEIEKYARAALAKYRGEA